MKQKTLFTMFLVIVLLTSFLMPVASAQGPIVAEDTEGSQEVPASQDVDPEPEEMLEKGLITQKEYEILVAEMETSSAGQVARPGSGISYVPPGWQRVDNAGNGGLWDSNDTFGVPNEITYSGTGASGLSMAAHADNSGFAWDTELWSPPIDLTGATTPISLTFESNFQDFAGNGDAYVDVSTNGGGSWTNIHSQTTDDPTGGELESFDLSAYVGNTIVIRWRYTCSSATAWYWHIDNAHVFETAGTILFEDFEPVADLSASSKAVSSGKIEAGGTLTYTLVLSNSGEASALNTVVTDVIPVGTTYITDSVQCDSGTCWYDAGDDAVYWTGSVADGADVDLWFSVATSEDTCGVPITNTAVISDPSLTGLVMVEAATRVVGGIAFGTDFEADAGGFANSSVITDTWAWGDLVPSTNSPYAAHSGTKLWATVLDDDIPTEPSSHYLTKTITLPDDPTGVYLQWWDWWDEDGLDEGYVYVNSIANTLYHIDSDQLRWEHHTVDLSPWAGQTVDLVFYHFSGGSGNGGAGWYLDDVTLHGGCPSVNIVPDQADSACAPALVDYQLEVLNANDISDVFDILPVADNDWPVTVDPPQLALDPGMTGTVSVTVEMPWYAEAGARQTLSVTALAQTSGLIDEAVLETRSALATGWEDVAPSPHGARYLAVVYDDGYLYQIGGNDASGYYSGTFSYDISADTWMTMTEMITPAYHIDAEAIGGNVYVPGGDAPGLSWSAFVQVYSTAADTWSTVAPMPVPVRYHEVVAYDGMLYVLGGQTAGSTYTNTVQIYDPNADAWSLGAPMTIPVSYAASGVIDGKIYLAGGYNGAYQTALQIYDPATDSWSYGADLPEAWVQAADAVKHDRYLILAGGYYDSLFTASNLGWFYDSVNDAWNMLPSIASIRYGAEGDSDGNEFYYMAGREYDGTFFYSNRNEHMAQCPSPESDIMIDAPSLSMPTCPGDTEMLNLQICNDGAAPLLFSFSEMMGTARLGGSMDFRPAGSLPTDPAPKAALSTVEPFDGKFVAPAAPRDPDAVLWDQPITTTNLGAYANQDFETSLDAADIFIADDFSNSAWWSVDTVYVPGNSWNLGGDLDCAGLLHWEIYADAGGVPAGDPWGGGDPPVWTYYGPTGDSNVALSTGVGGFQSNVTLNLDTPLNLPPGDWWLVFYPSLEFADCFQYGRHVSDTSNGAPAHVINPGGGLAFPTTWTAVTDPSTWALTSQDFAFRLEGDVLADVPWLSEDPTAGSLEPGQCTTVDVHLDATGLMAGDYVADLLIESNDPDTPTATLPVSMTVWQPVEGTDFVWSPMTGTVNATLYFTGSIAAGRPPVDFAWDFGDGSPLENGMYASHAYTQSGSYEAMLTTQNVCAADVMTHSILVYTHVYLPIVDRNE